MPKLTYKDLLNKSDSFLSLDISVNSTGWFVWFDNKEYFGTYTLKNTDSYNRRKEFGEFVASLYNQYKVSQIFIEDVIAGCNFSTTRALTELNCVPDDLMIYKVIPELPLTRVNNTSWKKELKTLSQDDLGVRGSNDKEMIQFVLKSLGFSTDKPQDVYDALGIALAQISQRLFATSNTNNSDPKGKSKKLCEDIMHNYVITQVESLAIAEEKMLKKSKTSKRDRPVQHIKYSGKYKSLAEEFREVVRVLGDDCLFVIEYPINKINNIALTYGFDLSKDTIYMTVYKR